MAPQAKKRANSGMENEPLHTWAATALRSTIARCIRSLCAQLEREARGDIRLAAKLRERAKAEGWA